MTGDVVMTFTASDQVCSIFVASDGLFAKRLSIGSLLKTMLMVVHTLMEVVISVSTSLTEHIPSLWFFLNNVSFKSKEQRIFVKSNGPNIRSIIYRMSEQNYSFKPCVKKLFS